LEEKQMVQSIFEEMGGRYERQGEYILPCLTIPPEKEQSIDLFGRRHLDYLREYRKITYTNLLTSGRLNAYLADIDELAESIKARGVMQNLTVVPNPDKKDHYLVVIGNRRLTAARKAGLKTMPCSVVEMTEKEQISTMLLENMQRSDLSVSEQAQGFQLMLDLGETETTIAEKTGFSRSTVRHRLNLAKLDQETLGSAELSGFRRAVHPAEHCAVCAVQQAVWLYSRQQLGQCAG